MKTALHQHTEFCGFTKHGFRDLGVKYGPQVVQDVYRDMYGHDDKRQFSILPSVSDIINGNGEVRCTLMGDHMGTLTALHRYNAARQQPVHVVLFDGHHDLWKPGGAGIDEGTWLWTAIVKGFVKTFEWWGGHEEVPEDARMYEVQESKSRLPVYVSVDIDVIDCSQAPGVNYPQAGGWSSWDLLDAIRDTVAKYGTRIIGCDIAEVNPLKDDTHFSTCIAAATAFRMLVKTIEAT